jgi:5'(3')-deoxyribonucleotidase
MQVASVKQAKFVMDEEKRIILVQGHECLCNSQHKDYDNNLVKDNSWKEIAGELHAQDKELSRTQHCRRMTG